MCKDHGTWVSRMTGHSVVPLWSNTVKSLATALLSLDLDSCRVF